MSQNVLNNPSELSKLAFQYGPFFFSVLFSLFIPKTIHGHIAKAKDPREKKVYIRIYQLAFAFGIALVVASVGWWFVRFPYTYVFAGKFCNLDDYVMLNSDSLFFKPVNLPFAGEEDLVKNVEFMIMQNNPFRKGQQFSLYLKKEGGEKKRLSFPFESEEDTEFEIKYIESKNDYEIASLSPKEDAQLRKPESLSPHPFLGAFLYAEELEPISAAMAGPEPYFSPQAQNFQQYIKLLQEEGTAVGLKIRVLHGLKSLSDDAFKELIETHTPKEPVVLTLLDLSRHSDRELAYAADVLLKRLDVAGYLITKLLAADKNSREEAETILFRIEKDLADKVFLAIPQTNKTPWIQNLQNEVVSGKKSRVLYPTGSNAGDRYYIFVEWTGKQVPECLAQKFAKEILFTSAEKELAALRNQSSRWVYAENKENALRLAGEILDCGAKAQFASIKSTKR